MLAEAGGQKDDSLQQPRQANQLVQRRPGSRPDRPPLSPGSNGPLTSFATGVGLPGGDRCRRPREAQVDHAAALSFRNEIVPVLAESSLPGHYTYTSFLAH